MNKANLFKRKTHSQNENLPTPNSKLFSQTHKQNQPFRPYNRSSSSWNQNSLNPCTEHQNLSKYTSPARRLKTEPFQIEPFSQIDNFMYFTNKPENQDSFIKTRRAKMHPKTPIRQSEQRPSSKRFNKKFQSNFQILKKQIQELQSLQILRGATGHKDQSTQVTTIQPFDKNGDKEWKQDDGFIATREFSCGKNISLMEKQRQNIKKVMKNKKFRNYINLHKKTTQVTQKKQTDNDGQKMKDFLLNETLSKTFVSLNNPETVTQSVNMMKSEQIKRKQTPQIVRKYYRPQSCNPKRQIMIYHLRPKKMKVQLANFVSFSSFSKSCQKKSAGKEVHLTQQLYNETMQKSKKNKQLLVVCL